jgi:hypothetical protein
MIFPSVVPAEHLPHHICEQSRGGAGTGSKWTSGISRLRYELGGSRWIKQPVNTPDEKTWWTMREGLVRPATHASHPQAQAKARPSPRKLRVFLEREGQGGKLMFGRNRSVMSRVNLLIADGRQKLSLGHNICVLSPALATPTKEIENSRNGGALQEPRRAPNESSSPDAELARPSTGAQANT